MEEAPEWFLKKILKQNISPQRRALNWQEMTRNGVVEGGRNSSIARLTGLLLSKGVDHYVCLDLMLCFNQSRCKLPLDEKEVATIVSNIARREYSKWLCDEKGETHG